MPAAPPAAAADLFGDPAPAAATATGQLTAEWLEYEIRTPGQPTQVLRRQIFDLLGPAARAAGSNIPDPKINDVQRLARSFSLLGRVEILPLACQLSPDYVNYLATVNATGLRDPLTKLASAADNAAIQAASTAMGNLPPVPGRLYGVALTRGVLSPQAGDVILSRLNVLSEHRFLRDGGDKGLMMCDGIDIVANSVAARPGLPPDQARQVQLAQGILDTNAETLLMDQNGRVPTVSDHFAGQPDAQLWLVVHDKTSPEFQKLDLSPDTRIRMEDELAQGFAIVLPQQASASAEQACWYRVDPVTGEALGINGLGWGATMTEYAAVGFIAFDACLAIAGARGKLSGTTSMGERARGVGVCALTGVAAGAAAVTAAFGAAAIVGGAAAGGAGGLAL